jgi:alanyl aminopeptidase
MRPARPSPRAAALHPARWLRVLALLATLLPDALALAAPARPSTAPRAAAPVAMRLPDSVQPLAYRLHLVVDPDQPRHQGEVEIDLKLHQPIAARGAIRLHAKDLTLRTVWLAIGARRWPGRVTRVDAERVDLHFGKPLPAGSVSLALAFDGAISEQDVMGLFRQAEGGQWAAFTQFQATGARQAFPLFDEPGWKVPWTLSLTVPAALTAVANMPVLQEAAAGPGRKRIDFEPTPPLPSYLLAFGVGRFDVVHAGSASRTSASSIASATADRPLPMRFIAPAGRGAETAYAAGVTGRIVQQLEDYFGLPYPYAKLDSMAIPLTTGFSAMEHAGLITYNASLLLARPDEQTPRYQRDYVSVAAHELAHQWFGNLVTPTWWDDLWLNESFASWMGDRTTAALMPDWGWQTSLQHARAEAMQADRLVSARRIEQAVLQDDDIGNLFDAITYQKGQTVLAMFEAWLGADRFQAGVRRYLQRHAWGSATSDDFFNALAVDDPALPQALRSFTRQPGIPLVTATLVCDDGPPRLHLAQSRLLPLGSHGSIAVGGQASAPGAATPRWQLPLLVRSPAGSHRLLLTEATGTLTLPDAACPAWLVLNAGGSGYYRVAHTGDGLARQLAAPDLSIGERLVLLDDARGLHDAGLVSGAQVQALLLATLQAEGASSREVVVAAVALLKHLQPLVPDAGQAAWAQRWQTLFGDRARALGWQPRPGDTDDDRLLRALLLPAVAAQGQDAALRAEARQRALAWLADRSRLSTDLRGPVLAAAARAGEGQADGMASGEALFDALLAALRQSSDRQERESLLAALGSFRAPALAARARQLLLQPAIDLRDSLWPLLAAQSQSPALRADALSFVALHHAALVKRLGRDDGAWLPELFAGGCSHQEARRIEATFTPTAPAFTGGRQALARTLEAVRLCTAWRAQQASGL